MGTQIHKNIVCAAVLFLILFITPAALADEIITIKEAICHGIKNNPEIRQMKRDIDSLKRTIGSIEASLNWQIDIDGSYAYGNNSYQDYQIDTHNNIGNMTLKGNNSNLDGLSFKSKIKYTEVKFGGPEEFKDKIDIDISVDKHIYPDIPSDIKRNYLKTKNQLLIAQKRLLRTKNKKRIEWLKDYSKLGRLKEQLKLLESQKKLARDNFKTVKRENRINEAGKNDLLLASINLKEAKLDYNELKYNYEQTVKDLQQKFGFDKNVKLLINLDSNYLLAQIKRVKNYKEALFKNENKIEELIKKSNINLKEIDINKRYTQKKYKWQKAEDIVQIYASSNYNKDYGSDSDYWSVGLNFSYNLFDGGQQQLALKEIQSELKYLKDQYESNFINTKNKLWSLLEEINLNKLDLTRAELAMEKKNLEKEIYKKQFKDGLINKYQFKQKQIDYLQAKINLKSAQDKLIFSKLELLHFVGLYK